MAAFCFHNDPTDQNQTQLASSTEDEKEITLRNTLHENTNTCAIISSYENTWTSSAGYDVSSDESSSDLEQYMVKMVGQSMEGKSILIFSLFTDKYCNNRPSGQPNV